MNVIWQPLSLAVWRERAQARECSAEYLARAYACRDMAMRTLDPYDAQLLRAMTLVWHMLADQRAGEPNAAARDEAQSQ